MRYGSRPTLLLRPLNAQRCVILGVSHSAQLLAETYQPAVFRAFFTRVKPEAICVERSPEEFARLDFYEFTYEAQFISVPYAKAHGLALCPIDWVYHYTDGSLGPQNITISKVETRHGGTSSF